MFHQLFLFFNSMSYDYDFDLSTQHESVIASRRAFRDYLMLCWINAIGIELEI